MHKRREAAEEIAAKLFHAEHTINAAISAAAELVALMPHAYVRGGLTAAYGQCAVTEAVGAVTALSAARERIAASHTKLTAIQRHVGLEKVAFGTENDKPPEGEPLRTGLRPVRADAAA